MRLRALNDSRNDVVQLDLLLRALLVQALLCVDGDWQVPLYLLVEVLDVNAEVFQRGWRASADFLWTPPQLILLWLVRRFRYDCCFLVSLVAASVAVLLGANAVLDLIWAQI